MSNWSSVVPEPLRGAEGALVSVRISVDPRLLEDVLEALAQAPFPINPELHHPGVRHANGGRRTIVEFPAYENRVAELRQILRAADLGDIPVETVGMLAQIKACANGGFLAQHVAC